jgi:hypothetical protein
MSLSTRDEFSIPRESLVDIDYDRIVSEFDRRRDEVSAASENTRNFRRADDACTV